MSGLRRQDPGPPAVPPLRARRIGLLVVLLGLFACGEFREAGTRSPATAAFEKTEHDFGRVRQGERVTVEFPFANRGELELTVARVRSGCECMTAGVSAPAVPPGARGSVRVELDTAALFGPQRRTVTVYTNDPARAFTVLTLSGHVDGDIAVDPPRLYLGKIRRGETSPAEAAVQLGAGVRVESVDADVPWIAARVEPALGGRPWPRLVVTVGAAAPSGTFRQTVHLRCSSARRPSVVVPVSGAVE